MSRLTPRQERFCLRFVESMSAAGAAHAAGYAPRRARLTGYRLLLDPRVTARIEDLQTARARAFCTSIEHLLGKLETVFRMAIEHHHFHAAARAVDLQAKLADLVPARPSGPTSRPRGRATSAEAVEDGPALAVVSNDNDGTPVRRTARARRRSADRCSRDGAESENRR